MLPLQSFAHVPVPPLSVTHEKPDWQSPLPFGHEAPWPPPPPLDDVVLPPDDVVLPPEDVVLPPLDELLPHELLRGVHCDGSGFVKSPHFWSAAWFGQS
jgi:hypothetical protein